MLTTQLLRALVGLTLFGSSCMAFVYQHELLRAVGGLAGLLVVVVILMPSLLVGLWLKKHPRPRLRALGNALEVVMSHGALMAGVVLSVIAYWGVTLAFGDSELPSNRGEFLFEMVSACLIFAAVVYGLFGGMIAAWSSGAAVRVGAAALTALMIAVPALALSLGNSHMRRLASEHGGAFGLAAMVFLAATSTALWRLFCAKEPAKASGAPGGAA